MDAKGTEFDPPLALVLMRNHFREVTKMIQIRHFIDNNKML